MHSWLQQQADAHPHKAALTFKHNQWDFEEVNKIVQQYANYYHHSLPHQIKRVAIYGDNNAAMYFSILGLWELGLEIQFINTRLTKAEIKHQLTAAHTTFIITKYDFEDLFADLGNLITFPKYNELTTPKQLFDLGYQPQQVASIMYTSGTTGNPKGVPQTFANHQASALATEANMCLTKQDSWLCSLPLFHVSGLSIIFRSLLIGLNVYLEDHYQASQVDKLIREKKVTVLSLVNVMLQQLLPLVPSTGYPSSFKEVLLGGGPAAKVVLDECKAKHFPVLQSYGLTETCSQIVALPPILADKKIGSSGLPLKNAHLKIAQPDKSGVGEIWLKGPSVVSHYLDHLSPESWTQDHWFKTGDIGYVDAEGFLYVKSRKKDLIISGGENIYPAEVEGILEKFPQVKASAVMGVPDKHWGQHPVAYLQADPNLNFVKLDTFLKKYLANYKLPKQYYLVNKLPRTASGKVMKRFLNREEVYKQIN